MLHQQTTLARKTRLSHRVKFLKILNLIHSNRRSKKNAVANGAQDGLTETVLSAETARNQISVANSRDHFLGKFIFDHWWKIR